MPINKQKRDKIVTQALQEISFARQYRQGKVRNWQKNEEMYYGTKKPTESSRANVDLGRMQEFVHTLLSKIDNPLIFKYTKKKNSQVKRVLRANAVRASDRQTDWWDIKDIVGKKQAIIYGRAIYSYYADSYDGYCAHLSNVDVYDFLIDPSAGGLDLEQARYMGRYGVKKNKSELQQGIDDKLYMKAEVERLLEGSGNADSMTEESINKQPRRRDQNVWNAEVEMSGKGEYKFWEWYTTYEGKRYYLLLTETGSTAIRIELLTDLFPATKQHPLGAFPFWTWAAFLDLTEFWTPSYCDYVREIFMAQSVSINQMLDNAEQINKPQKIVSVGMIEDMAKLKYRKDGLVPVKGEFDVNKAVQILTTPSITTPLNVFDKLEAIQEKASGVTAGAKGVADEEGKVGIYEGNAENTADRFGLLNKSYAFGYTRFAMLHDEGVRTHLNKKIAIDIMGPEGIEQEMVSKRDIYRKDEVFNYLVEASNAEVSLSETEKKGKLTFLTQQVNNQSINIKKSTEMQAQIVGFTEEEIRQLMDTSEFGDVNIMSEAERDIEAILDGKDIKPNRMANNAYKQKIVTYMLDNEEHMDAGQKSRLFKYLKAIEPIIIANLVRQVNEKALQMQQVQMATGMPPPEQAPEPAMEGMDPQQPALSTTNTY